MNVRLWRSVVLVGLLLTSFFYAPLRAMQDSTAAAPKATERPFWMWQIYSTFKSVGSNADFNAKVLGMTQNSDAATTELSFVLSPIHIAWSHNRWIVSGSFLPVISGLMNSGGTSGSGITARRSGFEFDISVGYALINTPRFRLYPILSSVAITDRVTITRQTSFANLLQTGSSSSFTMERDAGGIGIAVGADYRFPLEYGDVYVVAKAGYTISALGSWTHEGAILPDANVGWFSGRGLYFQLGIGLGSERQ